ncbi:MAG: tRNA (N(6)-L-threonylcarbamoyladenosine(37)-C(2))-methylthiotransferase MtaB [Calditrichaeota bacterium]|nr:tRNA (N(6)-L-threonylcarbamoyladenosine(37)-C(2))-methylthiotransferase MtaB [Calditrichota bacterium]
MNNAHSAHTQAPADKALRVAFYTFGCRLNQAETAIIEQSFRQQGYRIVDVREPADVVVINTCTVTENGDADTRRLIHRVVRTNPSARIALVGCQAQVQRDRLLEMPNVYWVVGNAEKMEFLSILQEGIPETPVVRTPTIPRTPFTIPVAGLDTRHTRANLKIQDGCDFFCSFCEIPFARGRARSREFQDIIREARELVRAGHHELVLTGINIGTYSDGDKQLVDVVEALLSIPELWRLRISSIEPTTIPDALVELMQSHERFCRHLHVPLQSGSNRILARMKRKYTAEEFAEFIWRVHQQIPEVCLGTDVIVGFPGETDDDFEETYRLLKELPLAYFHVFRYSERDHAPSRRYADKVDREVIIERSARLRELSARKRRLYYQQFIGKTERVLFEQKKGGFWIGLTDTYIRVKVQSDQDLHNRLMSVRLTGVEDQMMTGIIL